MIQMSKLSLLRDTVIIRAFAFLHIRLLWWVGPSVIENSSERVILKIPLSRRTRNHIRTMYFGALAMGAESAVAITAIQEIKRQGGHIDFIFKDFSAQFLKRADGDVHFVCEQSQRVAQLVAKAKASSERVSEEFQSYAIVPSKSATEKVATFNITLSLKARAAKV